MITDQKFDFVTRVYVYTHMDMLRCTDRRHDFGICPCQLRISRDTKFDNLLRVLYWALEGHITRDVYPMIGEMTIHDIDRWGVLTRAGDSVDYATRIQRFERGVVLGRLSHEIMGWVGDNGIVSIFTFTGHRRGAVPIAKRRRDGREVWFPRHRCREGLIRAYPGMNVHSILTDMYGQLYLNLAGRVSTQLVVYRG